jgi:hypothetical protein
MFVTALILFILAFAKSAANNCSQSKYCTPEGWCENFTSLIELNSALLDNSSCPEYFKTLADNNGTSCDIYIITFIIKANNYKGPINDRFDYQRFIQSTFIQTTSVNITVSLRFDSFDGIDLNFTLTNRTYTNNETPVNFEFAFAKFDFYLNGKPWEMSSDGGKTCDETELLKIIYKYKYGIFGLLEYVTFNFEFQSRNYNYKKWCPLVFENAAISDLNIEAKPIRFFSGNSFINKSSFQSVTFYNLVADNLDKEILNPQVYSLLKKLTITGAVRKIETDVFKEMKNLEFIILTIYDDFKGFIHGNGIEWMNYVNYYTPRLNLSRHELECDLECLKLLNSSVSWIVLGMFSFFRGISNVSFSYFPSMRPYAFPDEDFCIFSNYPHDRSVLIELTYILQNCTCAIIWMSKNTAILTILATQNNEKFFMFVNYQ